ncbi:MAG: hypothetical protein HQL10_10115 [Nitrospirae bacterium]|nr:hypothetical protein [Nitrospirota bacterium]
MFSATKIPIVFSVLFLSLALTVAAHAADESTLFSNPVSPDALIALDLSLSMSVYNPAGDMQTYGATNSCVANTTACSGSGCSGGFCGSSKTGCSSKCSRLDIAKRAIFNLLDDTNNSTISSSGTNTDDASLNIRLGLMTFVGCDTTAEADDGDTASGCIRIVNEIATNTKYSSIYCGSNSSCLSTVTSGGVAGLSTAGYTPVASLLREAKIYLDANKTTDTAAACRDKFVILITDGEDTLACNKVSAVDRDNMGYKRRRATVDRAKALADAGYKVFVVGLGANMPFYLKNTLNWTAYYGGTYNPDATQTGDTTKYTPYAAASDTATPAACGTSNPPTQKMTCCKFNCSSSTGLDCATPTLTNVLPSTAYSDNSSTANYCAATTGTSDGTCGTTTSTDNDPGGIPSSITGTTINTAGGLDGYAFIASNGDELTAALKRAVNVIRAAAYSFSVTTVSSARITSENNIYEASFQPIDNESFWMGHLKKYSINADGSVGSVVWDAGTQMQAQGHSSRTMKTYNGSLVNFDTTLTPQILGVGDNTTKRNRVVGYFRGETSTDNATNYNQDDWKLGDVWHSNPVVLTSPSPYFSDAIDTSNPKAWEAFRTGHQRTSSGCSSGACRVIVVGANDGQFHVIKASDGSEAFSFIPPNLLRKLQQVSHMSHPPPAGISHQYFVDGPVSAQDVWLGSGAGTTKNSSDWKTVVVFGEGRGAGSYLFSSSVNCAADNATYSETWTSATPYHCGYYALNFTDTLNPTYMWHLGGTTAMDNATGTYFAQPWSKMAIGRVKISGNEKWVGFVGGGTYDYSCGSGGFSNDSSSRLGKGFYVVDLSDGSILWKYTKTNNASLDYPIAASPAVLDSDNDGFIDTVYVATMGGDMWRFKLCKDNGDNCGATSNWAAGLAVGTSGGDIRPVYTAATISKDTTGNIWIYYGTGDKQCPSASGAQEQFYAFKDGGGSYSSSADFQNITAAGSTYSGVKQGWRMNFAGSGEKMLAEPTVFAGSVYFTTYTPPSGSGVCTQGGTGKLYGVNYTTGAGTVDAAANKSKTLGTGIPSAPLVSIRPDGAGADLYVTNSGGAGLDTQTQKVPGVTPSFPSNRSNMLYWRDKRVQ